MIPEATVWVWEISLCKWGYAALWTNGVEIKGTAGRPWTALQSALRPSHLQDSGNMFARLVDLRMVNPALVPEAER